MKIKKIASFLFYICFLFPVFLYSQDNYNKRMYEITGKEYYKNILSHYPEQVYNKLPGYQFEIKDTSDFKGNLPVLTLLYPNSEMASDKTSLISIIDFTYDPFSQWIILNESHPYEYICIYKGIQQRWLESKEGRLIPSSNDTVLPAFKNIQSINRALNRELLLNYLFSHPESYPFLIYNMDGIWILKEGQLFNLQFHDNEMLELDGETVYIELIEKYGKEGIESLRGGFPLSEPVIFADPKFSIKKNKKKR